MPLAEALDMGFVDDRVGVGDRRRSVAAPIEAIRDDQPARHERRRIERAAVIGVARRVAQDLVAPGDVAVYRPCIRVQEQLVGVAAEAARRRERADDPVAVALTRPNTRHEAVPDPAVHLLQLELLLVAGLVKQAQDHAVGDVRGHGEVGAGLRSGRAQRKRLPRPQLHLEMTPRWRYLGRPLDGVRLTHGGATCTRNSAVPIWLRPRRRSYLPLLPSARRRSPGQQCLPVWSPRRAARDRRGRRQHRIHCREQGFRREGFRQQRIFVAVAVDDLLRVSGRPANPRWAAPPGAVCSPGKDRAHAQFHE